MAEIAIEHRDRALEQRFADHRALGQAGAASNQGFFDYIAPTVAERRADPGEDWISGIVHSEVNGQALSEYEILAMIALVRLAGLDTVVNFLPICLEHLARHPEDMATMRDDPCRIHRYAEELLRRFPVVARARLVTGDIERDGVMLKEGEMVLVPSTLHGIDDRENDDPMTIDYTRKRGAHSTFGLGAHMCAGMHPARLEIVVTMQEWLKRIPEFRVKDGFRMVAHSGVVAQFERLDLEWGQA